MNVVRFRMRAVILLLALVISACGTAEAVVEPPPAPLPVPSVPAPSPPSPTPLPETPTVAPPPAPPPRPPRGSIHSQSIYPAPDLTEWTLANGSVVVFKPMPEADVFTVQAFAKGGWTALDPRDAAEAVERIASSASGAELTPILTATERRIEGQSDDLEALLLGVVDVFEGRHASAGSPSTAVDALDPIGEPAAAGDSAEGRRAPLRLDAVFSDPGDFTFILVGPANADLVAAAAGRHLTPLRASDGLTFRSASASVSTPVRVTGPGAVGVLDLAIRISFRADDHASLQVLRGALEASLQNAGLGTVHVDVGPSPWTDEAWLRVLVEESDLDSDALETAIRDALSGDALIVSSARRRLLRQLQTPTPQHWLDALTALYREGGGRQPGRDPASLIPLSGPISRVTDSDVLTLARRFAVSTDTALLLMP